MLQKGHYSPHLLNHVGHTVHSDSITLLSHLQSIMLSSVAHIVRTVIPWYNGGGVYGQYCCNYYIYLWALCTIQRTPAKQCKDSMLLCTHIHLRTACTRHMSALFPQVPPSAAPQPAPLQLEPPESTKRHWQHLSWSPDLGEGSSRPHTCNTCPWKAKRRRQDYRCTCMCGNSRGCPTSSGDKQAIRVTHRVPAELWTSGPQLVTGKTFRSNMTIGQRTSISNECNVPVHHMQWHTRERQV